MKSTLQFIFILLITFTAVRVDADTCVWKLGMSQEQINELIKADDFEMAAKEDTWFILFIPSERKKFNDYYQSAFEIYSRLAKQGSAHAQYRLSYIYRYGMASFPVDREKMVNYLKLAAAKNHYTAQLELGSAYSIGPEMGVQYDQVEAYKWAVISYLNRIVVWPKAEFSKLRWYMEDEFLNFSLRRGRDLALQWIDRHELLQVNPYLCIED